MQRLALGLYNVPRDQVKAVVDAGLAAGLRHFDSASFYNNEVECGEALKSWMASGHDRSEIFVTTKVWTTDLVDPESACRSAAASRTKRRVAVGDGGEISIEELDIGPVDLVVDLRFVGPNVCVFRTSCVVLSSEPMFKVMVHWPMPSKHVEAYVALEKLVRSGKAKGLGISNYSPADYEELMKVATIEPLVNTFENNPLLYRKEWCDYFQEKGLIVQAYKPLQRGGPVLESPAVMDIAKKAGKTPAQVCLRWNLDKGWVVEKQLSGMAPELQGKSLRIKRAVHRSSRLIE
ncbi:Putative reductase 1 [Durusdinium trenchii]|uniref:Reductase 1 n=1 Tax=Durusdinium trenchii TaxID=1381693 RepID=A0ABP0S349_9DINO